MNGKAVREIVLGLMGFALIAIGVAVKPLFFTVWVGAWMTIGALFLSWHRIRREARKQGKEAVFT